MNNEELAKLITESFYYDDSQSHRCMRWKVRPLHHFAHVNAMNRTNGRDSETRAVSIINGWPYCRILQRRIRSHICAWVLKYGEFPEKNVIPINGDKMDYSPDNLMLAEHHANKGKQYAPHTRAAHWARLNGRMVWVDECLVKQKQNPGMVG